MESGQVGRGADHGLWGMSGLSPLPSNTEIIVPLKVAFDGKTDIPIIQVSLPGDSSPASTVKLGKALSSLRDKGYGIIGSGQVVHNLRDHCEFHHATSGLRSTDFPVSGVPTTYNKPFLEAATSAVYSSTPVQTTQALFHHPLYKRAHPTPEHLLPILVSVAAADEKDKVEDIYVGLDKMGMGWGMWRWVPQ